jgi:hypothetical protein
MLASDLGNNEDPEEFWGEVDCEDHEAPSTPPHQVITTGGDTHSTATGERQRNTSFRRLTVYDGDDVDGERCELGLNDADGPTAFYHEGERRKTYISIRLPESAPIGEDWRVVMQMKQAQPYDNPEQASMFELQARDGRWYLGSSWKGVWDTPAEQNTWTRFVFDVVYSQDPAKGSIQVDVDLNGDGDYADDVDVDGTVDEHSPVFRRATLRKEKDGEDDIGPDEGESITSHLRAGIYQNELYPCPTTGVGCSVDIDNVQVLAVP